MSHRTEIEREGRNRERAQLSQKKLRQLLAAAVSRGFTGRVTIEISVRDGWLGRIASTCQEFDAPTGET